jgi:PQQ-like domain
VKSTPVIADGQFALSESAAFFLVSTPNGHGPNSCGTSRTPYQQNIVTPVLYHERLLFSGLDNGVMGVKVLKRGSKWVAETVWQNKDLGMYISSPVVTGDLLFGLSYLKRGQFFCLDPRTGG